MSLLLVTVSGLLVEPIARSGRTYLGQLEDRTPVLVHEDAHGRCVLLESEPYDDPVETFLDLAR